MVHGYHVIIAAYGFWLPNDPRGSWSDFVGKWELIRLGQASSVPEQRQLTEDERRQRVTARENLTYPAVSFSGQQAQAIGRAIGEVCRKNEYTIWAFAILPEHMHLVIARHHYSVEKIANLIKGQTTRRLLRDGLHPLATFAEPGKRPPRMWSERQWKVYLDSEDAIENAIAYVNDNPIKEGKPVQHWSFVQPFTGLDAGWTTYH